MTDMLKVVKKANKENSTEKCKVWDFFVNGVKIAETNKERRLTTIIDRNGRRKRFSEYKTLHDLIWSAKGLQEVIKGDCTVNQARYNYSNLYSYKTAFTAKDVQNML